MTIKTSKPPIILLLGRDDWQKDLNLNFILTNYIQKKGIKIAWEDALGGIILKYRLCLGKYFKLSESFDKFLIRCLQLLLALVNWKYARHLFRQFKDNHHKFTISGRCMRVRERIQALSFKYEVYIISRSSGGRVASLIADDLPIKHIICLGYPFQNPENGVEPERYEHLPTMSTPFLIIQGAHDDYGGSEVIEKYSFHQNTKIAVIDTDHGFRMKPEQWQILYDLMDGVLPKIDSKTNQ